MPAPRSRKDAAEHEAATHRAVPEELGATAGDTEEAPAALEDWRDYTRTAARENPCAGLCECLLRLYEMLIARQESTLSRAELFTLTGDEDNKDPDTGIYISVKTQDGKTLLASIAGADSSGKDMTTYNDDSSHIVPLVVDAPGITKDQCTGFKVHMWQKTNGDDKWAIDLARVTLYFSDSTNLIAEQTGFQLHDDGASTDFTA